MVGGGERSTGDCERLVASVGDDDRVVVCVVKPSMCRLVFKNGLVKSESGFRESPGVIFGVKGDRSGESLEWHQGAAAVGDGEGVGGRA